MSEPATDPIRDYILATRRTYTEEAIRRHLLDAGHVPAAVDAALGELMPGGASPATEDRADGSAGADGPAGADGSARPVATAWPLPPDRVGPAAPGERDLRWAAAAWMLILFLGSFLLLMLTNMPQTTYGVGAMILAGVMFVGGIVTLVVIIRNRSLARGLTSGILVGIVVPVVVAGAIVGLCVYTTNPTF